MSRMHNPPHPGEILREDVLPALGLTVTDAAAQLGVTRAAFSRVLNGRAAISPEMAVRLCSFIFLPRLWRFSDADLGNITSFPLGSAFSLSWRPTF